MKEEKQIFKKGWIKDHDLEKKKVKTNKKKMKD